MPINAHALIPSIEAIDSALEPVNCPLSVTAEELSIVVAALNATGAEIVRPPADPTTSDGVVPANASAPEVVRAIV